MLEVYGLKLIRFMQVPLLMLMISFVFRKRGFLVIYAAVNFFLLIILFIDVIVTLMRPAVAEEGVPYWPTNVIIVVKN